jgi:hypothetical protein
MNTATDPKADPFMQFAANALIAKGVEPDHAWTVIINTYGE